MRAIYKLIIIVAVLFICVVAWVWWNRPVKVDMAGYVPGDSLIYVEANDLPKIIEGLISVDSWRELASGADSKTNFDRLIKLGGFAATTGIGKSEWVVLSRTQAALVVLGFNTVESPDAVLKLTPRIALVAETHTSEWRVRGVVEKLAGDFARRAFKSQQVERKEIDDAHFLTWSDPSKPERRLVAAIDGSVVVIGNDEGAVRDCLSVRRGERTSLAGNERLGLMRERLGARDSLLFGFAPASSLSKFVEVLAPTFVPNVSSNPKIQSILANLLPQLAKRIVVEAGWSSRVASGAMEDRFFISLPEGVGERLAVSLQPQPQTQFGAGQYLPAETYQVSRYSFTDAAQAWKGLNAALASQVSAFEAAFVADGLEAMLKPYGVAEPMEFFKSVGSEIVTARLDQTSEGKVLIVSVRDREALVAWVRRVHGGTSVSKNAGDEETVLSHDDEQRAASFSGDYLIMGEVDDVRRCLDSHAANKTLRDATSFPATLQNLFADPPFVTTITGDDEQERAVVQHLAGKDGTQHGALKEQARSRRAYSFSQTQLTSEGLEKRTRSSFGLLGEMIERLAHAASGNSAER